MDIDGLLVHPGPYAGIGARQTPAYILDDMRMTGRVLASHGFTLRSGGADGADSAFADGAGAGGGAREIFLPWKGFNGLSDGLLPSSDTMNQASAMAMAFYPGWSGASRGVRYLQARNMFQVLGPRLDDPSRFIICWTKDGRDSGGTGTAIRAAWHYGIPVLNLYDEALRRRFMERIEVMAIEVMALSMERNPGRSMETPAAVCSEPRPKADEFRSAQPVPRASGPGETAPSSSSDALRDGFYAMLRSRGGRGF